MSFLASDVAQMSVPLSSLSTHLSWGEQIEAIGISRTVCRQHEAYEEFRTAHWSETSWKSPSCIIIPTSVQELQIILPALEQQQIPFSIRSGGHMPALNAASVNDGALIDLVGLDQLEYDAETQSVVVGAGLRWQSVYNHLDQYEVTAVGGRVVDVGVGGFILGGGLSYLSELHGLACDNVINFEVVLANGTRVDASLKENSDLFSALKGGSNNFGVVTAFTLRTFPIHQVWGGTRIYAWEQLDAVLDALLTFQSRPEGDPYASLDLKVAATNQTDIGIILTLVYLRPINEPEAFAPFSRIDTLVDTTRIQPLHNLISEFPSPSTTRVRFIASTFKPSRSLFDYIKQIIANSPHIQTIKSLTAGTGVFSWQPITPNLVTAGRRAGGNTLGLEDVHQSWFHIDLLWARPDDDEIIRDAGHAMMDEIMSAAKAEGSHLRYVFMNDADETQDVISSYGHERVKELRRVQNSYDPTGVFRNLAAGAFKLPSQ